MFNHLFPPSNSTLSLMYAILQVKHIEKEDAVRGTLQSQIVDVSSARFVVTQPKAAMQRERERERERERRRRGASLLVHLCCIPGLDARFYSPFSSFSLYGCVVSPKSKPCSRSASLLDVVGFRGSPARWISAAA